FLVHVHADILDVATHAVASLRERTSRSTESFPQGKVSLFSRSAYLLLLFLSHSGMLHSPGPLSPNALTLCAFKSIPVFEPGERLAKSSAVGGLLRTWSVSTRLSLDGGPAKAASGTNNKLASTAVSQQRRNLVA